MPARRRAGRAVTIEANVSEQDDIDNATALSHALAILTLVTGDEWTKQKLLDTNAALKTEASKALSSQGYTMSDASAIVEERWAEYESHDAVEQAAPQQGFRTADIADPALPTPVAEDTSWKEPAGIPTQDDLAARAADALARRRARIEAEQAKEAGSVDPAS